MAITAPSRSPLIRLLAVGSLFPLTIAAQDTVDPAGHDFARAATHVPVSFTATHDGRFTARMPGIALGFDESGMALRIGGCAADAPAGGAYRSRGRAVNPSAPEPATMLGLRFVRPDAAAIRVEAGAEQSSRTHVLRGGDPNRWQTDVRSFGELCYRSVWDGIDVRFHGAAGRVKYDVLVAAGADIGDVALRWQGARGSLTDDGRLCLRAGNTVLHDERPVAWQESDAGRVEVRAAYALRASGSDFVEFGFDLGTYDRSLPLTIDPGLTYSTMLGGAGYDAVWDVALDGAGHLYLTGVADQGFPWTSTPTDREIFVMKVDPVTGSDPTVLWTTFVGGSGSDEPRSLQVDAAGRIHVCGLTTSTDFPTVRAYSSTKAGASWATDACLVVLEPDGSTIYYGSYLGGRGTRDLALDPAGHTYLVGVADAGAPVTTTPGVFAPTFNGGSSDLFVCKLDTAQAGAASMLYMTYLGGSGHECADLFGAGIAVDASGCAVVQTSTQSTNYPTTPGAFQTAKAPGQPSHHFDIAVSKLNAAGSALLYSTYIGGSGHSEDAFRIALDAEGNAYLAGYTDSADFPLVGAFDDSIAWLDDAFVLALNATGTALVYSSYLGGDMGSDVPLAIAVDATGAAYVTGWTGSPDFPTFEASQTVSSGLDDSFVTKIAPDGSRIVFSTFLGGSGDEYGDNVAIDLARNRVYAVGETELDFPTTPGAIATTSAGGWDGYLSILMASNTEVGTTVTVNPEDPTTGAMDVNVTFANVDVAGTTTAASSETGPAPPAGFQLGAPATYWEITTEAQFTGSIEVCIDYSAVSYADENLLQLFHYEGGQWVDVTTSLDTANDVICGVVTSLSPFALFQAIDSDGDGLSDLDEAVAGTNPANPDSDNDGLLDGTEIDMAMGTGCPSPLLADSDGDGIDDGTEVAGATNPCNADTDGDNVPDGIDPYPLDPGGNSSYVETELRLLGETIAALPLGVIEAPNANAAGGRRTALANRAVVAANHVAESRYQQARLALEHLEAFFDGEGPDWIRAGNDRDDLAARTEALREILIYL